ncbi:ammonium transporter [Heterostelium album PN500]|uniref:Ammonium transporter n=1 Tax=Heterostelium pallidum (strain ATCC 26659 / Pp 5 / PN500) TaxID=670386 RepID=D3BA92_HETP5|nr:ammonium transporter [Heterostelium album PN500]EFA81479.1 ammonium transporter [Heterostelium album PN500]|eukprot:XP_020433597.1 ammonium transporter [Heterostelium album PN500]
MALTESSDNTTYQNCADGKAPDTGDTTWVLLSTILVLGMMPALAFFESGLLRSKNTLSIITQIISGIVVLTVMWQAFGFSLTFGPDQKGIIGNLDHAFLIGVSYEDCNPNAPHIPSAAYAMFMMMFANITPLLMTGAYAERVKYRSFIVLTIFWEIIVFYPVAHWIWGGGWMKNLGVLDFAGGIVIHTTAGVSSLVIALYIGRRKDFEKYGGEFPPSNIPLAALGAALLWMGWFGFNAGSALAAGSVATSAVASTQIGGSFSAIVWIILSWLKGKPSTVAVINGVIAGLAGITPASGYINSQYSIGLGVVLGLASYLSVYLLKHRLHIDDALDVSSVHGLTGIIGAIAIGFCAQKSINPDGGANGLFYGNARLLGIQVMAVVVAAAWSALATIVIIVLIDKIMGLRIEESEEEHGLDLVEHGEYAYHKISLIDNEDSHYTRINNHYQ